jgi:hypothetical protein
MAYTPPNTFTGGTKLTAADVQGNLDALRVYLHEGVAGGDLLAGQFIDQRHIQPPKWDPIRGLQHGVSGWQGGQWSGGSSVRVSFTTSALTGRRYTGARQWVQQPGTGFTLDIRSPATVLFHYFWEAIAGPDDGSRGPGTDDRYSWTAPYVGNVGLVISSASQETVNNTNGWENGASGYKGADSPYSYIGYGQHDGVYLDTTTGPQRYTVGLCSLSTIDRTAHLNWGVAVEVTYL